MKHRLYLTPLLALFLTFPSTGAVPCVTVDSLSGTLEMLRAGGSTWRPAKKGDSLFTNDMVRTGAKSAARLRYPGNASVLLRRNTQILINLHQNTSPSLLSRHCSLFYGAACFILKSVLPGAGSFDTKVYTPTTLISIRGTIFTIQVDSAAGATDLFVHEGTVQVKNIIRSSAFFVSGGSKTRVALSTDPLPAAPITAEDMAGLKSWIPASILSQSGHPAKSASIDSLRHEVLVMQVSDLTGSPVDLARTVSNTIAARLSKAELRAPVRLGDSIGADPLSAGRAGAARFVIGGSIAQLEVSRRARITAAADAYAESGTATVRLRLFLLDVKNNQVIGEGEYAGEASGTPDEALRKVSPRDFEAATPAASRSVTGRAIEAAINAAVQEMAGQLREK